MYQIILQYFEDRFASFFTKEPIQGYKELLGRIREAIPALHGIEADQIKILYKDIQLGTFINIDSTEDRGNLHLLEAFRNTTSTGSDVYRRVHLLVRETDSPFILKKRVSRLGTTAAHSSDSTSEKCPEKVKGAKSLSFATTEHENTELQQTFDWKASKNQQIGEKLQSLNDKKLALETHIRELELNVVEPPQVGNYNVVCGNCHIRGHRSEGNRRNGSCSAPSCTSYYQCGQKNKHKEHFEEIRRRKKELKEISREIDAAAMEKKNLETFQSKSISAFSVAVTPRLLKAFVDKYSPRTATGKLELQKDIATLRLACKGKIPPLPVSGSDRDLFSSLLQNQRKEMGIDKHSDLSFTQQDRGEIACSSNSQIMASSNKNCKTNVNASPIKKSRKKSKPSKSRKSRSSCSESSDSNSESSSESSSSESSPDSSQERKSKRRKKKRKKTYRRKKSKRASRKKKQRRRSSSTSSLNENRYGKHSEEQTCTQTVTPVDNGRRQKSNENATKESRNTSCSQTEQPDEHKSIKPKSCSLTELATIAVAVDMNRRSK